MNLLYINTHDTGRAISPYGFNVATNNLYELAKESVTFTHAFCVGPTCSPSRSALLTGTFPHQNGMLGLAQRGFGLTNPERHLARYLRSKGFNTTISGIQHESGWYLDIDKDELNELGYDTVLTQPTESYRKEDLHIWDMKNAEEVAKYLESYDSSKPFMISYGLHCTHRPFADDIDSRVDEKYVSTINPIVNNSTNRHDQAQFNTSAVHADDCVGVVLNALKKSGHDKDTIVIFTTDHGVAMPFNKCNLTDSGIGVSLLIHVPNSVANGTVTDGLVSQIDVFPTLCDLLEVEKPDYLEGKSFIKVFDGDSKVIDNEIYAEVNFHTSYEPIRCVRTERYKYIRYYDETWDKLNLSNMDESVPKSFLMKYDLDKKTKDLEELFDLYYDPTESHNLIGNKDYEEVRKMLAEKLLEKEKATNDPILNGKLEMKPSYKVNKKECLTASSKNPEDYEHLPE